MYPNYPRRGNAIEPTRDAVCYVMLPFPCAMWHALSDYLPTRLQSSHMQKNHSKHEQGSSRIQNHTSYYRTSELLPTCRPAYPTL